MSPERWKKIEEIFLTAIDLRTVPERARYLAEVCAGDEELRREVEKLLAQDEGAETLLKESVFEESGMHAFAALLKEDDPLIGLRLGSYQIISEIGSGGMGAVYLAERADGAFRQHVAIKLVKRGMDTNFILRRFRQERQILAALNHPFIARLLDGGSTADGLPYFVMEHIKGETLYRYSDQKKMSIAERLQLFRQVCEAVAYAHRNNVIHRDLKPSNVLIKADGTPKLLDFGIAKVLNPELAADTIDPTATHMRLMTPEYASPEQVRGETAAPASDIYSLGVLLYELLTGHRPYRLRSRAPHEIARVICEEEPQRPSTGLIYEDNLVPTGAGENITLDHIYQARGSASLEALRQELAGDLERIVLKALRKDPAERYQSALAFADDITRYLQGKPINAPAYYPARLSPASDEPSVIKTLAVLPLRLLSSDVGTDTGDKYLSVGLADAIITRLSGIRRLAVRPTSAVLRYGNETTDPFQAGRELAVDYALDGRIRIAGGRVRVSLQLLDIANGTSVWANQFDEQFADVLELEDSISAQVADALLPLLSEDERRRLNKRGTNNAAAFEAYLRGRFHWNTFTEEGFAKAIRYFKQAISLAPDYALAYTGIADYYNFLGVYAVLPFAEASAKAKEAALKAVALDDTLAEAYAALGFATLMHDFDWDLASQQMRRAVELNPNYATARLWYGSHLGLMGRFEEGFVQARQALELDPLTPMVHHTMNWMLYYARRYEESIAGTRRLIANEPQYGLAHLFLCLVLFHTGQYAEAFAAGQRCIELLGRSPYTLVWVASAYAAAGQREQAYALLDEIERMKAVRYVSPYLLAMVYSNLGETEQAFAKLEEAMTIRDARLLWLGVDPQFDRLRNDPHLHSLLRRTKNPLAARLPATAQEKPKADDVTSLAVLPFKLLGTPTGGNTGDEYLGIGLADALVSRLSKVQRLLLRPTSSVLRFGDRTDSFAAGRELGVDFVVDGTIRRAGERVRITAQLLNVSDNSTRWAEQFNEKLTDVLELEDSISSQVAAALIPQLTSEERHRLEKRGTNNPAAYEAYLRGRYFYNQFSDDGLLRAVASFREAITLDPNYALPHVGIADFYHWAAIFGQMPSNEAFPLAKAAARRALEIDDQLGEAYAILAFSTFLFDWDWAESERLIKRALELSPNYYFAHECYSNWLASQKRFAEAIEEIKRAEDLDPLSPRAMLMTAWTLYQARHYEEAVVKARQANELRPNFPQGLLHLGNNLTHAGRADEAIPILRESCRLWANSAMPQFMLICALVADGQREAARRVLQEMKAAAAQRYVKPYYLAIACAVLDEFDEAFAWLEKSLAERNEWLLWLATDTNWDRLRQDPRYPALLRRTNNPVAKQLADTIRPTGKTDSEKSLAVLPFKSLGANTGDVSGDFLGIGLADALITRLSTVRRFVVRPTSSVLRFGEVADSIQAGRELGVDFVLEGNIRRLGDRLRVSIQLLSVSDRAAEWAVSFDEKNDDVLALEDSISERVAKALIPHFTGEEQKQLSKRGTNNPQAYEAYLRGRYFWNQFTPESLPKALAAFQTAVALDPNYALAQVGLADFYSWANIYGILPSPEATPLAEAAARRAIALDDQLGEAYASLGLVYSNRSNWAESERLYKQALQLNPHYIHAHEWYGALLVGSGKFAEGIEEAKITEQLDPLSLRTKTLVAWTLYQTQRFDEGLEKGREILEFDKNYPQGYAQIALNQLALGRVEEAVANLQKFDAMIPNSALAKYQLCFALVAAGREAEARVVLEEIKRLAMQTYVKPFFLAMAHAALDEREAAFAYFEKSLAESEPWLLWLGTEPMLADLRSDPHFIELLKKANLR